MTGGFVTKWQVENDQYATRVLEKHWPDVRRWDDVRSFPPRSYEFSYSWRGHPEGAFAPDIKRETTRDEWGCDLICGGFPCTDISFAGKGAGLDGDQSGLWYEFARIIGVVRPRFVLVENVAALLVRGLDAVLGTLASLGYDAEWHCVPAAYVGAPHIRDRVFVLAHASRLRYASNGGGGQKKNGHTWSAKGLAYCDSWTNKSAIRRVADGVPARVDRLRCLGNAVVPQVAEWIGQRIIEAAK